MEFRNLYLLQCLALFATKLLIHVALFTLSIASLTACNGSSDAADQASEKDNPPTNDAPIVIVSIDRTSIAETGAGNTATLTAALVYAQGNPTSPALPVTVNLVYSGTATSAAGTTTDYTKADTILIPANANVGTAIITAIDDALIEGDETITVTIDTVTNATIGAPNSVNVEIIDSDFPEVSFSAASQTVSEGVGAVSLNIVLDQPGVTDITLPFSIGGASTATGGGVDYSLALSPITINTGDTEASIDLSVVDDNAVDQNKTVIITLGTPLNANLGTTITTTLTITDNDYSVSGLATPDAASGTVIPADPVVSTNGSTTVTVTAASGFAIRSITGCFGTQVNDVTSPYIYSTGTISNSCTVTANFSLFNSLTNTLTAARSMHAATLLPDGTVLITGGQGNAGFLNTAEIYNYSTQSFVALGSTMTSVRHDHTATLLSDGTVLLAGGFYDSAEIYNADPTAQTFTSLTNVMTTSRRGHTATRLPDGTVLLAGGSDGTNYLNTAEIYDPLQQTFTALGNAMTTSRYWAAASLLPNGQVLITGGFSGETNTNVMSAELYDPIQQTFTAISANMTASINGHTSTLLPNGQVLLIGGKYISGISLDTAEIYDPVANTFNNVGSVMPTQLYDHTATLLPNGQVLVTGGRTATTRFNTAMVYNAIPPSPPLPANSFTGLTRILPSGRTWHTATMLSNGKVLLAGGKTVADSFTSSALLYNPITDTYSTLANAMTDTRSSASAVRLANGKVLITGGNTRTLVYSASAELYDPDLQTFTIVPNSMTTPRYGHTSVLLPDGKVLIAGGSSGTGTTPYQRSAELYDPLNQTFTALASTMFSARSGATSTLLPNGKVLLTGGYDGVSWYSSAEMYDPLAQTFTLLTPMMTSQRSGHAGALLPNGKVLLTGGYGGTYRDTADVYDPIANTFTQLVPTMTTVRSGHSAILLPNGRVYIVGGTTGSYLRSAEVYTP